MFVPYEKLAAELTVLDLGADIEYEGLEYYDLWAIEFCKRDHDQSVYINVYSNDGQGQTYAAMEPTDTVTILKEGGSVRSGA